MPSKFQIYWKNLKEKEPEKYQARLKKNADRIRKKRHAIYADKEKHKKFKEKNRAYYRSRTMTKKSLKHKDTEKNDE